MLAADKLQLQSALKQQATALKEKEFNLHHSNFSKSIRYDDLWKGLLADYVSPEGERLVCLSLKTLGRCYIFSILDAQCTSNRTHPTRLPTQK